VPFVMLVCCGELWVTEQNFDLHSLTRHATGGVYYCLDVASPTPPYFGTLASNGQQQRNKIKPVNYK